MLRLGIVGCGSIAGYIASLARLNRGVRLTACCDRSEESGRAFARKHKIPTFYGAYEEILNDSSVDALYIATPHHLHYPMLKAAIQAGKPVWCEKPITRTLEEGLEIVKLANDAGIKVGVNYQYRYDAGCYALAMAARSGAMGEILYGRCNVAWKRGPDYFTNSPWHARLEQSGGGTLLTQGSHLLDLLLWACASPPRAATGMITRRKFHEVEVEDLAQGTIALESGAFIQISSAMIAATERPAEIELYGSEATALYGEQLLRPRLRFLGKHVRQARPPGKSPVSLSRSLEGFRAWIVEDRPYLIPARESLAALAAVEAIYQSAREKAQVAVQQLIE
jgi:UDP-N-acetyl-2-amino-2-deoxyglucuronate dehydrogenase